MMKKTLLLMLSLVIATTTNAEDVTPKQALEQARNFIQKRENSGNRPKKAPGTAAARLVEAEQVHGLYVFNVARDEGFVIVSNDDRTEPILGYSDTGNFDPENIPENMKAWLKGYADQIAWLNEHPEAANEAPAAAKAPMKAMTPTRNPVSPLLQSKWGQNAPFYNTCPTDPATGNRSVVGCAATAMAQVMYYHRWPTSTARTIPAYTTTTRGISIPAITSGTAFDWNNMLPVYENYGSSATDAQKTAVATLSKACGAAVQMDYASSGSGAYSEDMAGAMTTYFNYSGTTRYVQRGSYSMGAWNSLIYGELEAGRPVIYDGVSSGGGHAFVIDGYDGEELFHVNWGWTGQSDGYFLLSVLNPHNTTGTGASTSNDGYSFYQGATVGIKPYDGETIDVEVKMESAINSVGDGIISCSYWNWMGTAYAFDFGIGCILEDGTITPLDTYQAGSINSGRGYSDWAFYADNIQRFPNGTYKIVPISRERGAATWHANVNPDKEYVEAVVTNGTFTLRICRTEAILSATSFSYPGTKTTNIYQPVDVVVRNSGNGEYYGPLYLFASTTNSKGSAKNRIGVTILPDKSISTQFEFAPAEAGNYNIWICTDESGNNVIGQSSVTISTATSTGNASLQHVNTAFEIVSGNKLLGTSIKGTATIQNNSANPFSGVIRVYLMYYRNPDDTYSAMTGQQIEVTSYIPAYGAMEIPYEFDGLEIGTKYNILYYKVSGNGSLYTETEAYTCVAAAQTYLGDGTRSAQEVTSAINLDNSVCALNLTGVSGITSVTGGNQNTLFIFGANDYVPASLSGRNVVKGGVAENITLQDGYDFYSPATFIAQNITYTRTFNTGLTRDYRNWTTITLPFDVSRVTVDLRSQGSAYSAYPAYPIDWFRNAGDTKKNFWVMEFDSENNGFVNFSHASEIKAARPLLIAVPGAEWGSDNDLTGLPITFRGTNAAVSGDFRAATSGDNYKMKGVVAQKNLSNAYVLNNDGNAFTRQSSSSVDAFRAYFEPTSTAAMVPMLMMDFGNNQGGTTGLGSIFTGERETRCEDGWYMLDGRKLNGEPTQKGIYIYNGKKVKK